MDPALQPGRAQPPLMAIGGGGHLVGPIADLTDDAQVPILMFSPTGVVLVGGLAIAKVGYDKYLRFVWPLLLGLFVVATAAVALTAAVG